jgi:hypothetical protein
LALFGRRPPERVDDLCIPASENLHNNGHIHVSNREASGYRWLPADWQWTT